MNALIRRIAAGALVMALSCVCVSQLTGCNTVKGAGTDIQNVGQAGQNAIDNAGKK